MIRHVQPVRRHTGLHSPQTYDHKSPPHVSRHRHKCRNCHAPETLLHGNFDLAKKSQLLCTGKKVRDEKTVTHERGGKKTRTETHGRLTWTQKTGTKQVITSILGIKKKKTYGVLRNFRRVVVVCTRHNYETAKNQQRARAHTHSRHTSGPVAL